MRQLNDWAWLSNTHQLVPKTICAPRPSYLLRPPRHPTGCHVVFPAISAAMLIYVAMMLSVEPSRRRGHGGTPMERFGPSRRFASSINLLFVLPSERLRHGWRFSRLLAGQFINWLIDDERRAEFNCAPLNELWRRRRILLERLWRRHRDSTTITPPG